MKTKLKIPLIVAGLIAIMGAGCEKQESPPNIIFILADDMGYSQVGCYGSDYYQTPHIDNLASEGVRFTNAYVAAAVCSPTRASIMTGKTPARLHLTDFIAGNKRDDLLGCINILHIPGLANSESVDLPLVPWYVRVNRSNNSRWLVMLSNLEKIQ